MPGLRHDWTQIWHGTVSFMSQLLFLCVDFILRLKQHPIVPGSCPSWSEGTGSKIFSLSGFSQILLLTLLGSPKSPKSCACPWTNGRGQGSRGHWPPRRGSLAHPRAGSGVSGWGGSCRKGTEKLSGQNQFVFSLSGPAAELRVPYHEFWLSLLPAKSYGLSSQFWLIKNTGWLRQLGKSEYCLSLRPPKADADTRIKA